MKIKEVKTKTGKLAKIFCITENEYHYLREESGGYCLACGGEAEGIEPDARQYECENCGENRVYGIDELLLMGRIEIIEGKRGKNENDKS